MPLITWQTVFDPESGSGHPGGIDSLSRGLTARLFDDFEQYSSDGQLQAVWSVTNGGVGDPQLTTVANAVQGRQSFQITATGGTATASRSIPNNVFGFPVGSSIGRIRYVVFKAVSSTGNQTIRVRLADASDATMYKEWQFTIAQEKTREFIIDLYSGSTAALTGGGFLNTESYPGPVAEGATAWNPNLIDQISFRSLTDTVTFRFDDIRFYYAYSALDALGFGTEPATDDGADGSIQSKLRYLNNLVLQKIGETQQYSKYSPGYVRLNNSYTFGLELKSGLFIPSTTEITPGNYVINRIRNGTTTEIVASTTADEAAGFISATYTPLEDNWQLGDQLTATFSGGWVDKDTDTAVVLTANANAGTSTITVSNAALFQAGQRVRIYDTTPDTEIQTIVSIDSPTTLTVGVLANNYTTAATASIVLVERTLLETARIAVNVSHEPEITAELERWVLADYDDFDFADADGNNERWDVGYIANSDGSAAGAEGGTSDINTTTAGQARVSVDPDVTPTQSAYALKRDETTRSKYFSIMVDSDIALSTAYATSTFAGLRISAGDVDDPSNYILIAREASNAVNRITARAEFMGAAQTTVNQNTTDNAVAFKIERYGNVWNIFYSLTQYPNWIWTKLTQYEDVNGDMTSSVSPYLYVESGGTDDAQIVTADFDNWKYYIGSGAIDQLLSTSVLATGTFTTSSATVPADTGRTEANDYWNGTLLLPTTGVVAYQPRPIVDFVNAGGVFIIDPEWPFTSAPAVGDEYAIVLHQYPLRPTVNGTNNYTSPHVIGSKTDAAQYDGTSANSSIVRLLKAVHRGEILATGTLDTSSATVPADSTRTEANDYWNGSWLMTVSGDVAFQPRLITDFANAGGIFTLDAEQPFTAAPGLVVYVILAPNSQLVPAADSANNTTPAHVIGNKTDTIPAMNAAPGNDSIIRQLKAILERVGATPADPDDSVLTNLGQRDDAATSDDLSDITTTSIEAKLRRILLRFSSDAFSSTVQGVARTDVENMIQGLANYLSSAGAAWSVTADPGGAARDNLEQTIEDLAAVLAGSGMTTFPARAVAADGVSMAEVLRHASESIGENSANNVFDSSSVVVNEDGSVLERLEGISQDLNRSEYLLADYDDFDVADADADTERWNVGYLNGVEGGTADINTTTAGKLRVSVDPDVTPTAAGYAVNLSQPIVSKYFATMVDLDVFSFGVLDASWATLGIRVSPATYDINNVVYCQRQASAGGVGNRIAVGAIFNGVSQGEQYFTSTDNALSFKIERLDNVWKCYYSLTQYPDYVWVLLGQYEDPSEFMDAQQSIYIDAYSPGNSGDQVARGDFDNFKLYLNSYGISQEIAGDYDSSAVAADRDGSIIERQEFIHTAIGAEYDGTPDLYDVTVTGHDSSAIAANVDGSIDERLESLQAALGVVAAGAGGGFEVDGNPSLVTALGTTGAVVTDSATSVLGAIGADNGNNAFASTSVVENGDGSVLERLEEIRGSTTTGTFTLTNAMGTAEQTVVNYTPLKIGKIAVLLDLQTLIDDGYVGTIVTRLKFMVDGSNLRIIDRNSFLVGTDEVHPTVEGTVVEGASFVRVTIQANVAVDDTPAKAIPYRIVEYS